VGERPQNIEPDRHIDSPNTDKPHINVAGHLRRASKIIDGEFIWCDDDTFTVRPWTLGVYVRDYSIAGMLRLYPSRGHWSHAVRASIKVMESWGFDPENVPCGTIHRPWLVATDRVLRTLSALDAVGGGSFKALYVAGLDDVIVAGDAKVHGRAVPKPDADVISVFHDSWKANAGRIIRETFIEPSRWETQLAEVAAASVRRGPRRHHRR